MNASGDALTRHALEANVILSRCRESIVVRLSPVVQNVINECSTVGLLSSTEVELVKSESPTSEGKLLKLLDIIVSKDDFFRPFCLMLKRMGYFTLVQILCNEFEQLQQSSKYSTEARHYIESQMLRMEVELANFRIRFYELESRTAREQNEVLNKISTNDSDLREQLEWQTRGHLTARAAFGEQARLNQFEEMIDIGEKETQKLKEEVEALRKRTVKNQATEERLQRELLTGHKERRRLLEEVQRNELLVVDLKREKDKLLAEAEAVKISVEALNEKVSFLRGFIEGGEFVEWLKTKTRALEAELEGAKAEKRAIEEKLKEKEMAELQLMQEVDELKKQIRTATARSASILCSAEKLTKNDPTSALEEIAPVDDIVAESTGTTENRQQKVDGDEETGGDELEPNANQMEAENADKGLIRHKEAEPLLEQTEAHLASLNAADVHLRADQDSDLLPCDNHQCIRKESTDAKLEAGKIQNLPTGEQARPPLRQQENQPRSVPNTTTNHRWCTQLWMERSVTYMLIIGLFATTVLLHKSLAVNQLEQDECRQELLELVKNVELKRLVITRLAKERSDFKAKMETAEYKAASHNEIRHNFEDRLKDKELQTGLLQRERFIDAVTITLLRREKWQIVTKLTSKAALEKEQSEANLSEANRQIEQLRLHVETLRKQTAHSTAEKLSNQQEQERHVFRPLLAMWHFLPFSPRLVFLYVFLAYVVMLLLFLGQQFLQKVDESRESFLSVCCSLVGRASLL